MTVSVNANIIDYKMREATNGQSLWSEKGFQIIKRRNESENWKYFLHCHKEAVGQQRARSKEAKSKKLPKVRIILIY